MPPPREDSYITKVSGEIFYRKTKKCYTFNSYSTKKIAFTLAEVLITLGIIGVVAALTIPNLIADYKEKVLITQVKKAYSELDNALGLYMAKNECTNKVCISDTSITSEELTKRLFEQFQGAKFCTTNDKSKECQNVDMKSSKPTKDEEGNAASSIYFAKPYFVSSNGAAFLARQQPKCPFEAEYYKTDADGNKVDEDNDGQPDKVTYTNYYCANIYFDANGTIKGPNQFGADVYRISLTYQEKVKVWDDLQNVLSTQKLQYTPYNIGDPVK